MPEIQLLNLSAQPINFTWNYIWNPFIFSIFLLLLFLTFNTFLTQLPLKSLKKSNHVSSWLKTIWWFLIAFKIKSKLHTCIIWHLLSSTFISYVILLSLTSTFKTSFRIFDLACSLLLPRLLPCLLLQMFLALLFTKLTPRTSSSKTNVSSS